MVKTLTASSAIQAALARIAVLVLWGLVALAAILPRVAAAAPPSVPFALDGSSWEGCSELVRLAREELGDVRVIPTGTLDLGALRREDSVIILRPERTLDTGSLARFMRAGGRVILLDDWGTGSGLLEHFGLQRVPAPAHPAETLRQNPAFAIAEAASVHPVVSDVGRVVTNHPSGIVHPDLSPVLKIRTEGGGDVLVAVAGAVGQGRLLVVGDPSIVINSMLHYPGNRTFARSVLRYAADDDAWGKRSGRVYILANAFEQRGIFGEEPGLTSELAERARAMQDVLGAMRREGAPPWLAYAAAVAVGLGIVLWIGSNAARPHRRTIPRFVRAIPLAAQGGVAGHAAVIAAPGTTRALAMMELKNALEEELALLLGLDRTPAQDVLIASVASVKLLDTDGLHALKRLLVRMATIETLLLSRQPAAIKKIKDDEVMTARRTVDQLLARARQQKTKVAS